MALTGRPTPTTSFRFDSTATIIGTGVPTTPWRLEPNSNVNRQVPVLESVTQPFFERGQQWRARLQYGMYSPILDLFFFRSVPVKVHNCFDTGAGKDRVIAIATTRYDALIRYFDSKFSVRILRNMYDSTYPRLRYSVIVYLIFTT